MSAVFDASAFLATCSNRPGVYRMFDADAKLLYVGKAKSLKKRLASYFRKSGLAPKTAALVARIAQVETTITANETEALLLEQTLIKEWRPPYNILLRDDKSYPFVFLSSEDEYPRLSLHRGAKKRKGRYSVPIRARERSARASTCCRRRFSSASARTAISATVRGPACNTRSSAARGPAWGWSVLRSTPRTCATR